MAICTIIRSEKEQRICISKKKNFNFCNIKIHLVSCLMFDDELKVFPANCKIDNGRERKKMYKEDAAKRKEIFI